jgi:hypothetical protein
MKQYVIDQLRPNDHEKIKKYFDENFGPAGVGGIYWVPIDRDLLSGEQAQHTDCQPFYFAVDLEPDLMSVELLVRTRQRIRCSCIGYADERQRNWIIAFVDAALEQLDISI